MEPSENSEDGGLVVAGTCQQAVQTYPTHPPGNSRRNVLPVWQRLETLSCKCRRMLKSQHHLGSEETHMLQIQSSERHKLEAGGNA